MSLKPTSPQEKRPAAVSAGAAVAGQAVAVPAGNVMNEKAGQLVIGRSRPPACIGKSVAGPGNSLKASGS